MKTTKNNIAKGIKGMTAKAMSWSQVCKSISGIAGTIDMGNGESVKPLELMQTLGVHVRKNSYKPSDIFDAWSEHMKVDGKVCIARNRPYEVDVNGTMYALATEEEGEYKNVSVMTLCPLVSKVDKETSADVIVSPANVLRGLQQSAFITDTMERMAKSIFKCETITNGYVNTGDKKTPNYVKVKRGNDGKWHIVKKAVEKKAA